MNFESMPRCELEQQARVYKNQYETEMDNIRHLYKHIDDLKRENALLRRKAEAATQPQELFAEIIHAIQVHLDGAPGEEPFDIALIRGAVEDLIAERDEARSEARQLQAEAKQEAVNAAQWREQLTALMKKYEEVERKHRRNEQLNYSLRAGNRHLSEQLDRIYPEYEELKSQLQRIRQVMGKEIEA